MKLFDFLIKSATIAELKATDKESVISEMLDTLVKAKVLKKENRKKVLSKIIEREKQGSTGIGKAFAVPHLKNTRYVNRMVGVFGRCSRGIDFGAVDGAPCHLFFLILTPQRGDSKHIEALRKVAELARNPDFCRFMIEVKSRKEVIELLEEVDETIW